MTASSSAVSGFPAGAQEAGPMVLPATRSFYWSVRREVWEHRSIVLVPLAIAAVVLFGFLISTVGLPHRRRAVLLLAPAQQRAAIAQPYDVAAIMLILTASLVGVFYCLDALHGERRERSILFWKSLPVSDRTTVFSKASIPLIVLPLIIFVVIVLTQFLMLLWSSVVLLPSGLAATTWTRFNLFEQALILLYGLIALALWHAPLYGWLLLVSGWARRAVFLWAVLPWLSVAALEQLAFSSSHFASLLKYRLIGGLAEAFAFQARGSVDSLGQLTPARFLSTPALWIGLALAVAFVAGAVRLRRNREPI